MINGPKLFIDTEFNGFNGELLSMAIVSESYDIFYAILEHDADSLDPWVKEHVAPHFAISEVQGHSIPNTPVSRGIFLQRLAAFLRRYPCAHVIADWPEDIKHFMSSLIIGEGVSLPTMGLSMEIMTRGAYQTTYKPFIPHFAVEDAIANMQTYQSGERIQD